MTVLTSITVLLLYQLVGEVTVLWLDLPIPGPVIGMLLLFFTLVLRRLPLASVATTADALLRHLSLLFVPAGVGMMLHVNRIADEWLAITVALITSTLLTLIVTAVVMRVLSRPQNKKVQRHG